MMYVTTYQSPIGLLTIASDGHSITGLWMENQRYFGITLTKEAQTADLPVFTQAKTCLDRYFSGEDINQMPPPLMPRGTPFQKAVWDILRDIPYGHTVTYGEIASRIAAEREMTCVAPQAVGSAVGKNPIAIFIPCHRVLGAKGQLTGYAGGLQRKQFLLDLEKRA